MVPWISEGRGVLKFYSFNLNCWLLFRHIHAQVKHSSRLITLDFVLPASNYLFLSSKFFWASKLRDKLGILFVHASLICNIHRVILNLL